MTSSSEYTSSDMYTGSSRSAIGAQSDKQSTASIDMTVLIVVSSQ